MIRTVEEGVEIYKYELGWYLRSESSIDEHCSRNDYDGIQRAALFCFNGLPERARELRAMEKVLKLSRKEVGRICDEVGRSLLNRRTTPK